MNKSKETIDEDSLKKSDELVQEIEEDKTPKKETVERLKKPRKLPTKEQRTPYDKAYRGKVADAIAIKAVEKYLEKTSTISQINEVKEVPIEIKQAPKDDKALKYIKKEKYKKIKEKFKILESELETIKNNLPKNISRVNPMIYDALFKRK